MSDDLGLHWTIFRGYAYQIFRYFFVVIHDFLKTTIIFKSFEK